MARYLVIGCFSLLRTVAWFVFKFCEELLFEVVDELSARQTDTATFQLVIIEQRAASAPVDNASVELFNEEHDTDQAVGDWRLGEEGEDLSLKHSGTERELGDIRLSVLGINPL